MIENEATFKASADKVAAHFGTHLAVARVLGYDDLRNVSAWVNGLRMFPPQHCVTIERESQGKITRQELRPIDWQAYWPELVTTTDKA